MCGKCSWSGGRNARIIHVVHVMPFPHKPLHIAVVFLVDGGKAERGGDSGDREGEGHGLPAGLLRRLCRGLFFLAAAPSYSGR
jgi:hypothetical protein